MKYKNEENIVTLELVKADKLCKLKKGLQESFGEVVITMKALSWIPPSHLVIKRLYKKSLI